MTVVIESFCWRAVEQVPNHTDRLTLKRLSIGLEPGVFAGGLAHSCGVSVTDETLACRRTVEVCSDGKMCFSLRARLDTGSLRRLAVAWGFRGDEHYFGDGFVLTSPDKLRRRGAMPGVLRHKRKKAHRAR